MDESSRRLRTPAAAEYLGLATSTMEKDRVSGKLGIPFYKAGKVVVYDSSDLDKWLRERRRKSTSDRGANPPAGKGRSGPLSTATSVLTPSESAPPSHQQSNTKLEAV